MAVRSAAGARGVVSSRVTAKDVATATGVSTSVVSLVLNGKHEGRVSGATAEKVREAASRLGYRIDNRGRSLATGKTGFIGYVAPDVNPFFSQVQAGLLEALNPGYQLLTVVTDLRGADARENLSQMLSLNPDAVVVSTVAPGRISALRPVCPVLILDAPEVESDYPRINLDVDISAAEVARHLTGLGHRRFVHLDIEGGSSSVTVRRAAFLEAARDAAPDCEVVRAASPVDAVAARELVREQWPSWAASGATAIVCGSDPQAFGAVAALDDLGVKVPEDVSVVGADDQPFSTILHPRLTTVRVPALEMGLRAGERLRQLLSGDAADVPMVEVMETQFVVRDSTGPASPASMRR